MPAPAAPTASAVASSAIPQFWLGALSNKSAITFTFTNNAVGTAQHVLEASADAGVTWSRVGTADVGASSLQAGKLTNGIAYKFRLKAQDGGGESAYDTTVNFNTPSLATGGVPPVAPNTLAVGTITNFSAVFSWVDASSNESNFWLELQHGDTIKVAVFAPMSTGATVDLSALFGADVSNYLITARLKAIGGTAHANQTPPVSSAWSNSIVWKMAAPQVRITSQLAVRIEKGFAMAYQILTNTPCTAFTAAPLPAGLAVSATTGAITGTPTAAGTTDVVMTAGDGSTTSANTHLALTVFESLVQITSKLTATATVGGLFTYVIESLSSPGIAVASAWALINPPLWLAIAGDTITGTPDAAGVYLVQISATSGAHTGTATLTITVSAAAITSAATATAYVGQIFTFQVTALPAGCTFTADTLPAWLSLTSAGLLTGTPVALTSDTIDLTATSPDGSASESQTLVINEVALFTFADFGGWITVPVNAPIHFNGAADFIDSWYLSFAPEGLSLAVDVYDETKRTALITGMPANPGVYPAIVSVQVRIGGVTYLYSQTVNITISGNLFLGWFHTDPFKQEIQIMSRTRELARYVPAGEPSALLLIRGAHCKLYVIWRDDRTIVAVTPTSLTLAIRATDDYDSEPYFELDGAPVSEVISGNTIYVVEFDVTSDALEAEFQRLNAGPGAEQSSEAIPASLALTWIAGGITYKSQSMPVLLAQDYDR